MREPLLTALYVPGDRPDRFDKAADAGADMVILDLEDAVAPGRKAFARDAVVEWLAARLDGAPEPPVLQVRVNAGSAEDAAALATLPAALEFEIRVPKVESPRDIDEIAAMDGPRRALTAILESALGVERAAEIAAHPRVMRLALGEADLASDLGVAGTAALDYARVRTLFAARAAGLPAPMMSVYPGIRDLAGLRADTEHGRSLGLVGRAAVHPTQIAVIAEVFRPSSEEIAWAEEVLARGSRSGAGTLAGGEMVDPAMIGRARAVLARVRR